MNTRRRPTPRSVSYIALRSVPRQQPRWAAVLQILGDALTLVLVCTLFILALPGLAAIVAPR